MNEIEKVKQELLNCPTGPIWKKLGIKQRHGIDVILSSLHSKKSCGIGEYLDLIPLIDWCKKIPFDIIQLLPLNDTGSDPSPYNAQSSCALHPLFLSLHALPYIDELPELQARLSEIRKLTQSQRVEYHIVQIHKLHWLKGYVDLVHKKICSQNSFHEFVKNNPWIEKYALFKALKEELGQSQWKFWPSDLQNLSETGFTNLFKRYESQMVYPIVLQYLCFQQMTYVKKYANANGILLKGDIPILISPDSADVWSHPELFDKDLSAGAPPDAYSDEGQNWGFPLFQWDEMEKQNFAWWKTRLRVASDFYDIYRIDHIIGFFRIWGIHLDKSSKEGKYYPENADLWIPQGKKLLSMLISSSQMLPIGEDLGNVSDDIRECMKQLGICGTKIMRWERAWKQDSHFYGLHEYPPFSMTSVSTHDSETLDLWWRDREDEARAYASSKGWEYQKKLLPEYRVQILWESHHTNSLFHINLFQEYLGLLSELVRPNLEDERINIPGTLLPSNWTYRILPSIEQIAENVELSQKIQKIIFSEKIEYIYS